VKIALISIKDNVLFTTSIVQTLMCLLILHYCTDTLLLHYCTVLYWRASSRGQSGVTLRSSPTTR